MAITNAQQYKQLVNPPMEGKKRPGYRGDDAARSSEGTSAGRAAPPSSAPQGDGPKTNAPSQDRIEEIKQANQTLKLLEEDKAQEPFETLIVKNNNFPGLIGMGLNALKRPRQFTLNKNVDFFRFDPRTAKAREKYGLTAQGYKDYMSDRLAGTVDAAGNPIMGGGDNDDNIILPVDTTFNMGSGDMDQGTDTTEDDEFEFYRRFRADGGIMGGLADGQMDEMGRQMYGLGKLVKKATRAVKKIAKSPIGKAALLYTGAGALGNLAGGSGLAGMFKGFTSPSAFLGKVPGIFSKGGLDNIMSGLKLGEFVGPPSDRVLEKNLLGKFLTSPTGLITAASTVAGLLTPDEEQEAQTLVDNTGIDIEEARNSILAARREHYAMDVRARGFKADGGLMRQNYDEAGAVMSKEDMEKLAKSPLYKGFKTMYGVSPDMAKDNKEYKDKFKQFEQLFKKGYQKGGDVEPVAKKTMPLLDMGGMEKDYREDGGFVPIGRMERADDVPARLSKNEFVFTADAVRNAGDGDIDKGAEVMYNMMKNLEAGGEVSEESQGLEGARRMFQTSQRLEEVL